VLTSIKAPTWAQELNKILQAAYMKIYLDAVDEAQKELDLGPKFEWGADFHALAESYAKKRCAELVGKKVLEDGTIIDSPSDYAILDSTREMLRADLTDWMDQGLAPADISKNIQDSYGFSESRADCIARTETGFTWNTATINTYRSGGCKYVTVYDGDHDDECAEANEQIWTLDYADDHQLEHPNCVRSFGPASNNATPDRGDDSA
jgi:hypothetical protein